MKVRLKELIMASALLSACLTAAGQGFSMGTFHSYRGLGIVAETASEGFREFDSFALYADLAGVYSGDKSAPGLKLNYSHNINIAQLAPGTAEHFCLYGGSGFSTGWVSDSGKDGYGLCGALSGTFGARGEFACGVVISLGLTLETGVLLYKDDGLVKSTIYRDGLFQTIMPHICISYRLK